MDDEFGGAGAFGEEEVREWFVGGRVFGAGEGVSARAMLELRAIGEVWGPIAVFVLAGLDVGGDAGFEFGGLLFGGGIVVGVFVRETVGEHFGGEVWVFGVHVPEEFAEWFFFGGVFGAGEVMAAGAVLEFGAEGGGGDGFVFVFIEAELGVVGDGAFEGSGGWKVFRLQVIRLGIGVHGCLVGNGR